VVPVVVPVVVVVVVVVAKVGHKLLGRLIKESYWQGLISVTLTKVIVASLVHVKKKWTER